MRPALRYGWYSQWHLFDENSFPFSHKVFVSIQIALKQSYEFAHAIIHSIYDLMEHRKWCVLQFQSYRIAKTQGNNSIQEEPQWGPHIDDVKKSRELKQDQWVNAMNTCK